MFVLGLALVWAVPLAGCDDATGIDSSVVDFRTDRLGYTADDQITLSLTNLTNQSLAYDSSGCVISIHRRVADAWSSSGPILARSCILVHPHPLSGDLPAGETVEWHFSVSELPFDGDGEFRFRTEVRHPDRGRGEVFTLGFFVTS